mmetsp:Transcript_24066/g.80883  ORF Transcript_24066/g.80883 Transcript_24066/m.80883 type:complete len:335 (+) Transcript_24066:487-1491(+)
MGAPWARPLWGRAPPGRAAGGGDGARAERPAEGAPKGLARLGRREGLVVLGELFGVVEEPLHAEPDGVLVRRHALGRGRSGGRGVRRRVETARRRGRAVVAALEHRREVRGAQLRGQGDRGGLARGAHVRVHEVRGGTGVAREGEELGEVEVGERVGSRAGRRRRGRGGDGRGPRGRGGGHLHAHRDARHGLGVARLGHDRRVLRGRRLGEEPLPAGGEHCGAGRAVARGGGGAVGALVVDHLARDLGEVHRPGALHLHEVLAPALAPVLEPDLHLTRLHSENGGELLDGRLVGPRRGGEDGLEHLGLVHGDPPARAAARRVRLLRVHGRGLGH